MLRTLLISFTVFTVLYLGFVMTRYGLMLAEEFKEEARDAG
jgi:hypothetical protein